MNPKFLTSDCNNALISSSCYKKFQNEKREITHYSKIDESGVTYCLELKKMLIS